MAPNVGFRLYRPWLVGVSALCGLVAFSVALMLAPEPAGPGEGGGQAGQASLDWMRESYVRGEFERLATETAAAIARSDLNEMEENAATNLLLFRGLALRAMERARERGPGAGGEGRGGEGTASASGALADAAADELVVAEPGSIEAMTAESAWVALVDHLEGRWARDRVRHLEALELHESALRELGLTDGPTRPGSAEAEAVEPAVAGVESPAVPGSAEPGSGSQSPGSALPGDLTFTQPPAPQAPERTWFGLHSRGYALLQMGRREEAVESLEAARTVQERQVGRRPRRSVEPIEHYYLSNTLALLGDEAGALDHLAISVARSGGGVIDRRWVRADPDYEALRGHPLFDAAASLDGPAYERNVRELWGMGRADWARWLSIRAAERPGVGTGVGTGDVAGRAAADEPLLYAGVLLERDLGPGEPADPAAARRMWVRLLMRRAGLDESPRPPPEVGAIVMALPEPGALDEFAALQQIGYALRGIGEVGAAGGYFERLAVVSDPDGEGVPGGNWYDHACALALAGRSGQAIEALERSGFDDMGWALVDPDLDGLSDEEVRGAIERGRGSGGG